ncbi:MAG: hypothetical protein JXA49_08230, partial [Actinobacteria bacterium]|nr:hypothetical protein [Actinomycetota bacterium]
QYVIFETSKYNTGTSTYYDFNKYCAQTLNGTWQAPELITNADKSGTGSLLFDLNTRGHALFETVDGATTDNILYESMQPDPTPPSTTYYFAEGTTRAGFQEWLCIQNSGPADANVNITYMLETGENLTQDIPVSAHSRSTIDVNNFIGPEHDVSALVTSDQLIVAERPMYFDRSGWQGGTAAIGSTNTGRLWYFAEGTTRPGFQEYLTLQNPSGTDAPVTITYMLGDGTTSEQQVTVPGRTRRTVDVNTAVGPDRDVSVKVESHDTAIVAERPMYFVYHGAWSGGHNSVGTAELDTRWYFAEGTTLTNFETYLCLQNPHPVTGNATITYILGDGSTQTGTLDLPPTSRQTVTVNNVVGADKDVSMIVDSSVPILAERPMYFNYHGFAPGGHVAVGGRTVKNSWYLAEGTTRTGFDEWLSIENAGPEPAVVTITYIMGDGTTQNQNITVTPHTRATVDVRSAIGSEKDVSVSIWSDKGVLVERPMYFSAGDRRWPGGTNVMGL